MHSVNEPMSKLRTWLFPVHNWEMPKFMPMATLIFMTVFTFTMLRTLKDMFVVGNAGAETLSYIKFLVVLPLSVVGSLVYIRLRLSFSFEKAYYIIVGVFVGFFAIFWAAYPYLSFLHMQPATIKALQTSWPTFRFLWPLLGNWMYTLYYAFAELWGSFCLSVLFWQFANDNCGPNESKRFYPLFILIGNVASFILSYFTEYLSYVATPVKVDYISLMTLFMGVMMIVVMRWLKSSVLIKEEYLQDVIVRKKKKMKLSFVDSMKHLFSSKYIGYVAIMILSYGIMVNLVEQSWKAEVKAYYPSESDWLWFMSYYNRAVAVAAIVFVYLSKGVIQHYGWRTCALITPICLGLTGIIFFTYVLFDEYFMLLMGGAISQVALMGAMTAWIGGFGIVLSKSAKYSFFDPSKEMAFIPLEDDLRTSGKAAADGVGARLGKSGGGAIQIFLFSVFTSSTQQTIAPVLAIITVALGIFWLISVMRLSVMYEEKQLEARADAASA